MLRYIFLLSLTLGCAACGLKGPLYLPEKTEAVVVTPASSSSSSASSTATTPAP